MKSYKLHGVAILLCVYAFTCFAADHQELTEADLARLSGASSISAPDLYHSLSECLVLELRPSADSGIGIYENVQINIETGQLVTTGPVSLRTRYSGEWRIVSPMVESEPDAEWISYEWDGPDRWERGEYGDPFLQGGMALVFGKQSEHSLGCPFSSVFSFPATLTKDLVALLRVLKDCESRSVPETSVISAANEKLGSNLLLDISATRALLATATPDSQDAVIVLAAKYSDTDLAVFSAAIAGNGEVNARSRIALLLEISEMVPEEERKQVLAGIVAIGFSDRQLLRALFLDPRNPSIFNSSNLEIFSERIRRWLNIQSKEK